MPTFSKRSTDNLATCHRDLQKVAHEAIKHFDFVVICGHRGKAEQQKAFREKKSKLQWPNSLHNKLPSLAMDCVPVPLNWQDKASFDKMGAVMKEAAKTVGVRITWGGNFRDWYDGPHVQLEL
jgi:hypothetical protein